MEIVGKLDDWQEEPCVQTLITAENYQEEPCPECGEVGQMIMLADGHFTCESCWWDSVLYFDAPY
jgi:predicted RNA-binding Zn-ribbon protein involved in translation (DUF1610 family)